MHCLQNLVRLFSHRSCLLCSSEKKQANKQLTNKKLRILDIFENRDFLYPPFKPSGSRVNGVSGTKNTGMLMEMVSSMRTDEKGDVLIR